MGKYIVELKKNETLYKAASRESDGTAYVCSAIGTPYTAPDLEQVRKEAYYKGYETAKHECEDCNANAVKIADDNAHEAYQKGLEDAWDAARKIIHMPEGDILNTFTDVYAAVCTAVQVILKYDVKEAIDCIRRQEEENGLRQNIQTIVDECGYSLDEIAEVLQKMKES